MKLPRGEAGYISSRKKWLLCKVLLEFGIVAALIILGFWQTGTKKNLLTVVAIVGCLPASKSAVLLITIFPYKTIAQNIVQDLAEKAKLLTKVYDTVLTSTEKIMPVDCFVISGNTICGYASHAKADTSYTADFLKRFLEQNGYEKISVKVFDDYHTFLTRVEGLNRIAEVEQERDCELEEALKNIITNISM